MTPIHRLCTPNFMRNCTRRKESAQDFTAQTTKRLRCDSSPTRKQDEFLNVSAEIKPLRSKGTCRRTLLQVPFQAIIMQGAALTIQQTVQPVLASVAENPSQRYEYKTFSFVAPVMYEEIDAYETGLGDAPVEVLLRDSRLNQGGNVINLSKLPVPEGGPTSMSDIGTPEIVGKRLTSQEANRRFSSQSLFSFGAKAPTLLSATGEIVDDKEYYRIEYTKVSVGVQRRIISVLCVAGGLLYTFTSETEEGRFREEEQLIRSCIDSFRVK
ncbi:Lumenal PsbP-like protein [Cymbomonas tetramitiformis]|uniref:Lumenal PsbP-like protein n=1 Tax=Cymbomonas tetramitiformis TaxID=36881 RepID=A0AAE0FZ13_9CHLO|nr:Lumenal PsbP-like protein [Cymbomonas tetramitiformis]